MFETDRLGTYNDFGAKHCKWFLVHGKRYYPPGVDQIACNWLNSVALLLPFFVAYVIPLHPLSNIGIASYPYISKDSWIPNQSLSTPNFHNLQDARGKKPTGLAFRLSWRDADSSMARRLRDTLQAASHESRHTVGSHFVRMYSSTPEIRKTKSFWDFWAGYHCWIVLMFSVLTREK